MLVQSFSGCCPAYLLLNFLIQSARLNQPNSPDYFINSQVKKTCLNSDVILNQQHNPLAFNFEP
jgi:hypothetical protein